MSALQKESCRDFAHFLGPYVDGELDAPSLLSLETHVIRCAPCREEVALMRAMRGSLKDVVRTKAPEGLRARVATAMSAERLRGGDEREAAPAKVFTFRTMAPLAGAAALALLWGAAAGGPFSLNGGGQKTKESTASFTGGGDVLDAFVGAHRRPLPPEATDAKSVRGLERYVGVPVQPARFEHNGAKLVGGRVLPVHEERAAVLQYVVDGDNEPHTVTVFVYDPTRIRVNGNFSPHPVGTADVRVAKEKGYSVAVTEHDGVGYALATDFDPDRSAHFAAQAYDDPTK